MTKGIVPILIVLIVATALVGALAIRRTLNHIETKEERHQRQIENR